MINILYIKVNYLLLYIYKIYIIFETSICQFNSSKCSPVMPDEVRERPWQEIRDHSFIQNHSRPFIFPDPWRCFFSSVPSSMTVLLLFSSQLHDGASSLQFPAPWRCCFSSVPSSMTMLLLFSSQLHDGASSLQFPAPWRCFFSSVPSSMTVLLLFSSQLHDGASSLQFPAPWRCCFSSGQRTGMHSRTWFCTQWPIFVLFLRFVFGLLSGWKIQTWPIIRFLTDTITCWFFICWYLIESMMPCV